MSRPFGRVYHGPIVEKAPTRPFVWVVRSNHGRVLDRRIGGLSHSYVSHHIVVCYFVILVAVVVAILWLFSQRMLLFVTLLVLVHQTHHGT
jgi:hypothetical protein